MPAPVLSVNHLDVTYGSGATAVTALKDITFDVRQGEFVCVVGPSGCGKTTLLKSMSGLLKPSRGEVSVLGSPVNGPHNQLALVFQEYTRSMLPWLTVGNNITFPLAAKGVGRAERHERAVQVLERVGLGDISHMYPWQLSGGMQQRVAIARALAYEPTVLLMDEPFASVDAQARSDLEDLMLSVHATTGLTFVFVTHDIDESVYLADRVVVLSHRPTTVRDVLSVDLSRPRDQLTSRSEPHFIERRAEVMRYIQAERLDEKSSQKDADLTTRSSTSRRGIWPRFIRNQNGADKYADK
ncbi:MAG TPA: ABC transporter ATP-binding protein [Trebonia sp.]|nr:ABC transporter ATP-binding protein [Trebonia sp.]